MKAAMRLAIVALICGFAAGPVLLDACLFSCQNANDASPSGVPACHHTDARPGAHLNSPAKPCGHDHHANAATIAPPQAARALRPAHSSAALSVDSIVAAAPQSSSRPISLAQPRFAHGNRPQLTPLRV